MASAWDAEMQERFERLEHKVDHLGDKVSRVASELETVAAEVKTVAAEVKTVAAKVDVQTERLDRFERTFASKVEIENLRDLVQRSAEGFAATLDRIERGVTETRRDWQLKWEDHDRVLRDHGRRITRLESE
jgi:archaellum component FlaC